MSAPVVATAAPPPAPAQTRQKSSNAIHRGADAIMTLLNDEIGKVTHHYEQEIQGLHRQLSTVISVSETASAALDSVRQERDNAVADALKTKEAMVKAIEQKDALQREVQDAAARQKSTEVAATQHDILALTREALLHSHRKALVDKLTSDVSTITDERDNIRAEKVKAEAEAASKEIALQTLRREMDACMSRLQQRVSRVEMERDTALAEGASMKETVTSLQSSVAFLEAERNAATAELNNKSEEADALRQTQISFQEAAAAAEAERDTATRKLTERLAGFELAAASLTTERDGARAEVQKQFEELSTRATRISQLEAETTTTVLLKDLQEKLAGQAAALIQRDRQLSQLKEKAEVDGRDQKEKLDRQDAIILQRDEQISRLNQSCTKARTKLEATRTALADEKSGAQKAEEAHTELLSQRDATIFGLQTRLAADLASATSEISRLKSENQTIEGVLQTVVAERAHAETAVATHVKQISERDEQMAKLKAVREQASTLLEQKLRERDERITELENVISALKTHIARLQSSATDEQFRLERQLESANSERSTAQSTITALKQQVQDLTPKSESTTPQQVNAMQRQVKALTEERDALRKELMTPAQRAAMERTPALIQERDTLVRKVRERDEAIEKVRLHIPPQFVALETQVRTLEAERNALQAEARSVEAIKNALRDIGLDCSAPGNTFSLGENCVPQLTHLIDLGQKVQEMCQDLSVAQGDLTNDAEATILSLDSLHPFSLLSFFTIVDDWLTAAVATGDGWEKLYREKLQESVKLREQRNRDKVRVEKTEKLERSLKAKSDEFIQFKATLQKDGIVYDDKTEHGFVFAGKALECVREIAPFVVKVQKTAKAMHEVYPESGIEGLLKAPDTNPRVPMGVLKQMRKWIAVAQMVSEGAWEKYVAHEGDMKQAKRRNATSSSTPSSKPKSMPTPLSIRPPMTRDAQAGSSSPLSVSSPLTDITTRTAKRPSQPTASSSQSTRVLEPPKKKRKIQESTPLLSATSQKPHKEEEEDGLTRLARVFSSDGSGLKRSAPESSSGNVKRPKPPSSVKPSSSAKPPLSKG